MTALRRVPDLSGSRLPRASMNIVTAMDARRALVKHPTSTKIAFTGATEVGRAIRKGHGAEHRSFPSNLRQVSFRNF